MRHHKHILLILFLLIAVFAIFMTARVASHRRPTSVLTVSPGAPDSFPVVISDNYKREVTVSSRPARLISLAPSVTEILFAIGAGDRVVADTPHCDYPPAAVALPKAGDYNAPNIEKIAAMKPDLVFCDDLNGPDRVNRLKGLGISVVVIAPKNLTEVQAAIKLIGRAVGETQKAQQLADGMQQRIDAVQTKTSSLPENLRPRTLFLFAMEGGLYSAGPNSYIDDFIRIAGGQNIAAAAPAPWPVLSSETVVRGDPEVILLLKGQMGDGALTKQKALEYYRAKPRWQTVTAVKQGRLALLNDDQVTLPGPRMVEGLEEIAAALHPELFAKNK